jgi:hypothetical protein
LRQQAEIVLAQITQALEDENRAAAIEAAQRVGGIAEA